MGRSLNKKEESPAKSGDGSSSEEEEYVVEKIMDRRVKKNGKVTKKTASIILLNFLEL
jgi:hypothetical protein